MNPLLIFAKNCNATFFGLDPWWKYLKLNNNCDVESFKIFPPNSDIPLLLLVVVDDLLRLAGIVAVIYVIIGAISFITSRGNSEDAAKARGTVINALVGLAIAVVAVAFVSFVGNTLGK